MQALSPKQLSALGSTLGTWNGLLALEMQMHRIAVCVGGGGGGDTVLSYTVHSEQMLLRIEAQLYTHRECITFRPRKPSSLSSVHSCASMLNNICSESMSAAKMSLYSIVTLYMYYG